jgi:proton-dependent oligopeptide transporter, POT family
VLDPASTLRTYREVFWSIGLVSVILGVLLGVASFWLKRLGHGKAGEIRTLTVEPQGPGYQDAKEKAGRA